MKKTTEMVYLHGAGLNADIWGDVPGRAINLPGHGGRTRARRATAEQFAEEILPDIPQGAVLVGFSLGGMVALAFANRYPDHLRGLVLVDTPLRAPLKIISWYTPFVAPIVTRVPGMGTIAKVVGSRIDNAQGQARFRDTLRNGDPSGLSDALIVAGRFDGAAALENLRVPLQVQVGARSLLTGEAYRDMVRAACPHAEIVELDTGHHIPSDDPEAMNREILRFAKELP
ncbi:MAG: alpha/beta hydrolase [Pseudomonadota bacterium]